MERIPQSLPFSVLCGSVSSLPPILGGYVEFKRVRLDEVGLSVHWVNRDPLQSTGVDFRPAKGRAQGSPRCAWIDIVGLIEIPCNAWKDIMGLIEIPRYTRNDINADIFKRYADRLYKYPGIFLVYEE